MSDKPPDFLAMGVELAGWRPCPSGKLLGVVAIRFPMLRLTIRGCPVVLGKHGDPQLVPPSRPLLDTECRAMRDAEGRIVRERTLDFDTIGIVRSLSRAVVHLIREAHPGAFDRV